VHVRWLELVGFRNYAALKFLPDPGLNVLVGPNGHGKTSLLEAVAVLLTGRSFRTPRLAECVGWDHAETMLTGEINDQTQQRVVRLAIRPRPSGAEVRGEACPWARAVTFAGTDVAILMGLPVARRAFLDGVAAKLVPAHVEACRRYRVVLHQRTRLLHDLAGRAEAARLLAPWDEQLATLGAAIVHRRLDVLAQLAVEASALLPLLSPHRGDLRLEYVPSVTVGPDVTGTAEHLAAALSAGRPADLRRRLTLRGPHRDDLAIHLGRADARTDASRGEQRLLALGLRLAEAVVVERRLGRRPVLLFDDLLSELDRGVRERLLGWLGEQGQVLFTATDGAGEGPGAGALWDVTDGTVRAGMGARDAA
jgi:DNA replication and repair protein RecF